MLRKKYFAIVISLLMVTGTTVVIIETSDDTVVKASGTVPEGGIGLDHDWIWDKVNRFANVIHDADWSEENDIPKGRAWASAGENYTIARILYPFMNGSGSDCGLTNMQNLTIGKIIGSSREYSTMIQIGNYNLDIYKGLNPPTLYKDLTLSEVLNVYR
jgi:hypothetical protein